MFPQASNRVLLVYREADRVGPYHEALVAAGLDPVIAVADGTLTLDGVAGLVLTGGTDVDPALYGEERGEHTDEPDTQRDRIEFELLTQATEADFPVLAICRGLQLLNVFQGGTLHQHLEPTEQHRRVAGSRAEPIHPVLIEEDSALRRITGLDTMDVNSRHHQAVARLGTGLRVTAHAPDGTIEALERPDMRFMLAVQWHPEDQVFRFPEQLALFSALKAACSNVDRIETANSQR